MRLRLLLSLLQSLFPREEGIPRKGGEQGRGKGGKLCSFQTKGCRRPGSLGRVFQKREAGKKRRETGGGGGVFLKLNILVASFGLDWRANISFFLLGVNALLFPYKQGIFYNSILFLLFRGNEVLRCFSCLRSPNRSVENAKKRKKI